MKISAPLLFLAAFLALVQCLTAQICGRSAFLRDEAERLNRGAGRIVGGKPVTDCTAIPWQVRLDLGGYLCGGSILDKRRILTAAHCTDGIAPEQMTVFYGETAFAYHNKRVGVHRVDQHESYDSTVIDFDISILHLKEDIVFDRCAMPVCIGNSSSKYHQHMCIVSGWGTLASGGNTPDTLQMVGVLTTEGKQCDREKPYTPSNVICARYPGKDSCQGDSGGPLVCLQPNGHFAQVGVVSYGRGCADEGFPGVYTKVATFNDWITGHM